MTTPGEHTEHEDHGWDINIPDHPPRTDSPEYKASRARLHNLTGAGRSTASRRFRIITAAGCG